MLCALYFSAVTLWLVVLASMRSLRGIYKDCSMLLADSAENRKRAEENLGEAKLCLGKAAELHEDMARIEARHSYRRDSNV